MMKKVLILFGFILCASLSACSNTADGIGRDLEGAGRKIQNAF